MNLVNRGRLRNKLFYGVVILFAPVWVGFLILMLCWDIAQNFRGQINAGYRMIMSKDGMK